MPGCKFLQFESPPPTPCHHPACHLWTYRQTSQPHWDLHSLPSLATYPRAKRHGGNYLVGWPRAQLEAPVDSPHCILWFDYIQASTFLVSFRSWTCLMILYTCIKIKTIKGIFEPKTFHTNLYLQSPSKCPFYHPSAFCVWLLQDDVNHNFATTLQKTKVYTQQYDFYILIKLIIQIYSNVETSS